MMTKLILTIMMTIPMTSHASESGCLANIIFAESRGESIEGAVAVGQATLNRAKKLHKSICKLSGVSRLKPPGNLIDYYKAISKSVISSKLSIIGDANSWNKGKVPQFKGKVHRHIGKHVFYAMEDL
jgi:spore germination cell wall hydrolase CwlJ-like protein